MNKKRRGRPPIPIAVHLARGTFRADRHGPKPPTNLPDTPRRLAGPMLNAVDGASLIAAIQQTWQAEDVVAQTYLRTVAFAYDRRQTIAALLDGPAGLLTQLASGKPGISAKSVEVLLKGERQANEDVWTAIDRLQLDDAVTTATKRGVA